MTETTLGELKKFFYNDAIFGLEYQLKTIENSYVFETDLGEDVKLQILTGIQEGEIIVDEDADAFHVLLVNGSEIVDRKPHTRKAKRYQTKIDRKISDLIGCELCGSYMGVKNSESGKVWSCTNEWCENTYDFRNEFKLSFDKARKHKT